MTDATHPPATAAEATQPDVLDPTTIEAAAAVLGRRVRTTPLLTVDGSDLGVGGRVTFKLEHLQHSGTFKARGALHVLSTRPISAVGVTAASGGNHGAAVAWAAARLGHRATIFVPTISAPAKVDRLRSLGAEVVQTGRVYAEALDACREHEATTGATPVHAYEGAAVVAGAGTTGRELEAQVAEAGLAPVDTVMVACGGGGLAGGIAAWFDGRAKVAACETEGTAAWARARVAGEPVEVEVSGLAADALGASRLGQLAYRCLSGAGAASVVVDDEAASEARRFLWDRYRLAVEVSAAVPVAALRTGAWIPSDADHTAVIVCGANTSPADLDPASTPPDDLDRPGSPGPAAGQTSDLDPTGSRP